MHFIARPQLGDRGGALHDGHGEEEEERGPDSTWCWRRPHASYRQRTDEGDTRKNEATNWRARRQDVGRRTEHWGTDGEGECSEPGGTVPSPPDLAHLTGFVVGIVRRCHRHTPGGGQSAAKGREFGHDVMAIQQCGINEI